MRSRTRILWGTALALTCSLMAAQILAAEVPVLHSDRSDLQEVYLTVYNQNLALVREVREINLPAGDFSLEYREVPSSIQPATLLVEADPRTRLTLYDQNYEYDLMTPDKILEKYVGREVSWIQEDGSRITGRLLGVNGRPVYQVGEEILFGVPGRLALPDLPPNLRARPTLVWNAHAGQSGKTRVEASYLTGGLNWHCDYVLQLDRAGTSAGMQAWVTLDNQCGTGFDGATLQLVAGDINRATQDRARPMDMGFAVKSLAGAPPSFQEESLYDYHLYTLDRPTDLKDKQTKQVSLFDRSGIKVSRRYLLQGNPRFFRGYDQLQDYGKIKVIYSFENAEDNRLGMPMPAGVVRIYGLSSSGGRQLLGEDRIDHTPQDETVDLTVGTAFDIVAERVRESVEKVSDRITRNTNRVTLRNHKDEDIVVDVREPVGGQWEVLESTFPAKRISASELGFSVPVKAGKEAVLKYRVEVRY